MRQERPSTWQRGLASDNDLICVTGSLFLVGHVKSLMMGKTYEPVLG